MGSVRTIEQILDLARWAPSGDNTQPWRFEIVSDDQLIVYGHDTRTHCVYDLDGHPSQMALGALLETIMVAASGHGLRVKVERRRDSSEDRPIFDVKFAPDGAVLPSPLLAHITTRSVQRRPLSTEPLTAEQKTTLEAAAAPFLVHWHEGWSGRWAMARLLFRSAKIRLITQEAYQVHINVIDWRQRFSEDKVPDAAIGLDPFTLKLMSWVMQRWERVQFFNTYLMGTVMPRIQLDFVPALTCAAHFRLQAPREPQSLDDYVEAGRGLQRFWLTATSLGLMMQPEMTPLIFARYAREERFFTQNRRAASLAKTIWDGLKTHWGVDAAAVVFLGRIGHGTAPASRSRRKPLAALLQPQTSHDHANK